MGHTLTGFHPCEEDSEHVYLGVCIDSACPYSANGYESMTVPDNVAPIGGVEPKLYLQFTYG